MCGGSAPLGLEQERVRLVRRVRPDVPVRAVRPGALPAQEVVAGGHPLRRDRVRERAGVGPAGGRGAQAAEEEAADGDAVRVVAEGALVAGAAAKAGEERAQRAGRLPLSRLRVGSPLFAGGGKLLQEAVSLQVQGLVSLEARERLPVRRLFVPDTTDAHPLLKLRSTRYAGHDWRYIRLHS